MTQIHSGALLRTGNSYVRSCFARKFSLFTELYIYGFRTTLTREMRNIFPKEHHQTGFCNEDSVSLL